MSLPGNIATRVWLVLFLVYSAFFSWYTSFGGPLTTEEIAQYRGVVEEISDGNPERIAVWQHFMQTDTGDDFGMISVANLNETPTQIEGVGAGVRSDRALRAGVFAAQRIAATRGSRLSKFAVPLSANLGDTSFDMTFFIDQRHPCHRSGDGHFHVETG